MVHSLRKYLSNRGSALFMVISTMTALMVTCMAMYFAVVSSRTAQYAVFNQEQSYQAARSTSELFLNGLQNGDFKVLGEDGAASNDLMEKLRNLKPGESITTDGNGFASLNASATGKDDEYLGAYDVTITCFEKETIDNVEYYTFDVAVTVSINDVKEVVHSVIHARLDTVENTLDMDPQVFASTGYTDQDSYLDGGNFLTDMFIDNENAVINAYPEMQNAFAGNFSAGGSLQVNGYMQPNDKKPVVWAIRNKLYESPDKNFTLKFYETDTNRSKVLIGGDLDMGDNWGGISNADIYVNGDWYYGRSNFEKCRLFVHGNIYIRSQNRSLDSFPVYCDGQVFEIEGGIKGGSVDGTWEGNKNLPEGALTRHDAMTTLDDATATTTYYKWEINDSKPSEDKYVEELDEAHHKAVHKTLKWVTGNYDGGAITPVPVQTLTYGVDGTGCIIDDTLITRANNSIYDMTLLIDTGDDPENVYTIRVKANRDLDGDTKNETFCWHPLGVTPTHSDPRLKILVKGRGSVVIDVPEGVTYQDSTFVKTSHYNWWVLAGGTVDSQYGSGHELYSNPTFSDTMKQFIHTECGVNGQPCSSCSYKIDDSDTDEECPICKGKKKQVTCERHEYSFLYCPKCEESLKDSKFAGKCLNRVGRQEIDKYLAENPDIAARMEKDADGNLIYPTTNIFIVSSEESADIRMSITKKGELVGSNTFFGYIYAPYMTFKGYGSNQGGGELRFFGGATVSDFIFQDAMSFATCWPEKLPEELMSTTCHKNKLSGASKEWKISLGHY